LVAIFSSISEVSLSKPFPLLARLNYLYTIALYALSLNITHSGDENFVDNTLVKSPRKKKNVPPPYSELIKAKESCPRPHQDSHINAAATAIFKRLYRKYPNQPAVNELICIQNRRFTKSKGP
jgi:hypothetical protein